MKRHILIFGLCTLLVLIVAANASAATKTWNKTTGNWNVSGNWTPSGIPTSSDEVKINNSSGKPTIPSGYTAVCYRGYVYNATTPTLTIASGGTLNISAQFVKVGFGSTANTQDGVCIQNGNVNLTSGADLTLGDGYTSSYSAIDGRYYLNSGTLAVDEIRLGERNAFGHLYQSGGSINASAVTMAYDANADAEVRMTGGTMVTGSLTIRKGTFDLAKSAVVQVGTSGLYVVDSGILEIQIASTSDFSRIQNMTGNVTLASGCTLSIEAVDGYTSVTGHEMKLLSTSGSISGTFTNVPAGWTTELRNSDTELWLVCTAGDPLPAFPGAEGEGKWCAGGRGGDVYHVTNLNDSGSGSLREGVTSGTGARTIVFDVGGTITLASKLRFDRDDLTIAGQTAPGMGVLLRNHGGYIGGNNVILRHLRFRPGDADKGPPPDFSGDSLEVKTSNAIVDHVSASWSIDECLSSAQTKFENITMQYCLIGEGLDQTGLYHDEWNSDYDPGGSGHHSFGGLLKPVEGASGTSDITIHHCIYLCNWNRNPAPGCYVTTQSLKLDFRNNVIYNCRQTGYSSGAADWIQMNYVGNYVIAGPSTHSDWYTRAFDSNAECDVRIYQTGNKADGDRDTTRDGSTMTWSNFTGTHTQLGNPVSMEAVTTEAVDTAYSNVLAHAGAWWWDRDSVDTRLIGYMSSNGGDIIDSQSEVGGYPTITSASRDEYFDTDGDGMSNTWENANGTNPDVADNNGDVDSDGWTNLEEYINSLAQ